MKIDMERYKDKLLKQNFEPRNKTSLAIALLLSSANLTTIPLTGPITATMINTELGRAAASQLSLNDPAARALAEKTSGEIKYSDFRGKSIDPFIREDFIDDDTPFTLDPECTRVEYEIVGGGGAGAGGHALTFGASNDLSPGAGGGGAAQYKIDGFYVTDRNLYIVVGKGGVRGRGGLADGNPSVYGENGGDGTNTEIRIGSESGSILAFAQAGFGGKVGEFKREGYSGAGGDDGDGNKGGASVVYDANQWNHGNDGNGRAGGSGSVCHANAYNGGSYGGNGGQAGTNGGGRNDGSNIAGCGGGGGLSASPWGGYPGFGGAAWQRVPGGVGDHNWLIRNATNATGFGNGGGGGCKTAQNLEMTSQNAGTGGNGSGGRVLIRQYRR